MSPEQISKCKPTHHIFQIIFEFLKNNYLKKQIPLDLSIIFRNPSKVWISFYRGAVFHRIKYISIREIKSLLRKSTYIRDVRTKTIEFSRIRWSGMEEHRQSASISSKSISTVGIETRNMLNLLLLLLSFYVHYHIKSIKKMVKRLRYIRISTHTNNGVLLWSMNKCDFYMWYTEKFPAKAINTKRWWNENAARLTNANFSSRFPFLFQSN